MKNINETINAFVPIKKQLTVTVAVINSKLKYKKYTNQAKTAFII